MLDSTPSKEADRVFVKQEEAIYIDLRDFARPEDEEGDLAVELTGAGSSVC